MNNPLQWLFVTVMTIVTVLSIFWLADVLLMGLISLIVAIFDYDRAGLTFKYGISLLFGIELVFTLFAVLKNNNEGDKE